MTEVMPSLIGHAATGYGDTEMQRLRLFLLAAVSILAVTQAHAAAVTNGPVSTNVGINNYSVYYTTVSYQTIQQNIGGVPNTTSKYSLTSPNSITGLGTNTKFMLPWWNPSNSAAAIAAATAWYNASGWPRNNGVQYPNSSGTVTPFFAYGTTNGGNTVQYVALNSSGTVITSSQLINVVSSFALAGVSN